MITTAALVILASVGAGLAAGTASGHILSMRREKEDIQEVKPADDCVEI